MSAERTPTTLEREETVWSEAPAVSPSWNTPVFATLPEPTKRPVAIANRLYAPPASTRVPLSTVVAPR